MKKSFLFIAIALLLLSVLACKRTSLSGYKLDIGTAQMLAAQSGEGMYMDAPALQGLLKENKCALVDLRSQSEFDKGHVNGAINIPLAQLYDRGQWRKVAQSPEIALTAASTAEAAQAWLWLRQLGIDNVRILAPNDTLLPEQPRYNYWEIFRLATERHKKELEASKPAVAPAASANGKKIIRPQIKTPTKVTEPAKAAPAQKQEEGC